MSPAELRIFRTTHGLTQPQLAAKLGYSTQEIFRWEKGARNMPRFLHLAIENLGRDLARERTQTAAAAEETGR